MAVIDLKMAFEVDTKQLDKLQDKMKQADALLLKKIEKATSVLPKGIEKVDHAMLQMMSKAGVYVDKLVEHIRSGIELICSKMDEMKSIIEAIRGDLAELEEALNRSSLIQFFTTVYAAIFSFLGTLAVAKGSASAAIASIGAALSPLLLLLGKAALIVGKFFVAFKATDALLELTGLRKYIDDFMLSIVENFWELKDSMSYLSDQTFKELLNL